MSGTKSLNTAYADIDSSSLQTGQQNGIVLDFIQLNDDQTGNIIPESCLTVTVDKEKLFDPSGLLYSVQMDSSGLLLEDVRASTSPTSNVNTEHIEACMISAQWTRGAKYLTMADSTLFSWMLKYYCSQNNSPHHEDGFDVCLIDASGKPVLPIDYQNRVIIYGSTLHDSGVRTMFIGDDPLVIPTTNNTYELNPALAVKFPGFSLVDLSSYPSLGTAVNTLPIIVKCKPSLTEDTFDPTPFLTSVDEYGNKGPPAVQVIDSQYIRVNRSLIHLQQIPIDVECGMFWNVNPGKSFITSFDVAYEQYPYSPSNGIYSLQQPVVSEDNNYVTQSVDVSGCMYGNGVYMARMSGSDMMMSPCNVLDNDPSTYIETPENYSVQNGSYLGSNSTLLNNGDTITGEWWEVKLPNAINPYRLHIHHDYSTSTQDASASWFYILAPSNGSSSSSDLDSVTSWKVISVVSSHNNSDFYLNSSSFSSSIFRIVFTRTLPGVVDGIIPPSVKVNKISLYDSGISHISTFFMADQMPSNNTFSYDTAMSFNGFRINWKPWMKTQGEYLSAAFDSSGIPIQYHIQPYDIVENNGIWHSFSVSCHLRNINIHIDNTLIASLRLPSDYSLLHLNNDKCCTVSPYSSSKWLGWATTCSNNDIYSEGEPIAVRNFSVLTSDPTTRSQLSRLYLRPPPDALQTIPVFNEHMLIPCFYDASANCLLPPLSVFIDTLASVDINYKFLGKSRDITFPVSLDKTFHPQSTLLEHQLARIVAHGLFPSSNMSILQTDEILPFSQNENALRSLRDLLSQKLTEELSSFPVQDAIIKAIWKSQGHHIFDKSEPGSLKNLHIDSYTTPISLYFKVRGICLPVNSKTKNGSSNFMVINDLPICIQLGGQRTLRPILDFNAQTAAVEAGFPNSSPVSIVNWTNDGSLGDECNATSTDGSGSMLRIDPSGGSSQWEVSLISPFQVSYPMIYNFNEGLTIFLVTRHYNSNNTPTPLLSFFVDSGGQEEIISVKTTTTLHLSMDVRPLYGSAADKGLKASSLDNLFNSNATTSTSFHIQTLIINNVGKIPFVKMLRDGSGVDVSNGEELFHKIAPRLCSKLIIGPANNNTSSSSLDFRRIMVYNNALSTFEAMQRTNDLVLDMAQPLQKAVHKPFSLYPSSWETSFAAASGTAVPIWSDDGLTGDVLVFYHKFYVHAPGHMVLPATIELLAVNAVIVRVNGVKSNTNYSDNVHSQLQTCETTVIPGWNLIQAWVKNTSSTLQGGLIMLIKTQSSSAEDNNTTIVLDYTSSEWDVNVSHVDSESVAEDTILLH